MVIEEARCAYPPRQGESRSRPRLGKPRRIPVELTNLSPVQTRGMSPQDPLLRDRLNLRGQEDLEVSEHPGVGTEASRAREGVLLPLGGTQSASFQKLVGPSSAHPPHVVGTNQEIDFNCGAPYKSQGPGKPGLLLIS